VLSKELTTLGFPDGEGGRTFTYLPSSSGLVAVAQARVAQGRSYRMPSRRLRVAVSSLSWLLRRQQRREAG
jgi:hypothetical protein